MGETKRTVSFGEHVAGFIGLNAGLMVSLFFIRVVVDTSFRMVYPFIPQISEGLALSIGAFSWLLSVRSASGLLGPVFGSLADRYGRRIVMMCALLVQGLGLLGIAFSSGWWVLLPMLLVGMAPNGFVPAQQAYISDQVSFERRGRALAVVETAFAVSGIVLLPQIGWTLDAWGWRIPFFLMGILSLIAAAALWLLLPKTESRSIRGTQKGLTWSLVKRPQAMASIGVALLTFIAVGIFMTFWGIWLNKDFGFTAVNLGWMATIIGISELAGALSSGLLIDRIGKRRGNMVGLLGGALMFGLIPLLDQTIFTVRLILVLTVLLIEFSVVSLFPLYAEQMPEARATIFSLVSLGAAIGFMVGPPLATNLWEWRGVFPIAVVGAVSLLLAFILVWRFLFDRVG